MSLLDWARARVGTARVQQLASVLHLRPIGNSLEAYVPRWTFLPLEFNYFAEKMVKASPRTLTTDSYKALTELLDRFDTALVTFDPTWLQHDLDYLTTLLSGKQASEQVQREFLNLDNTKSLFLMQISSEDSAAVFIEMQIRGFLRPVVECIINDHLNIGLDIQVQPRLFGPGHSTVIADARISLIETRAGEGEPEEAQAPVTEDLVKGAYKVPRVLTYIVLLWMLYLARQGYAPDPDKREDVSSAEKVASLILNQVFMQSDVKVFMQQAVSSGTRSYLSNGRHYVFAKVGADRTKMILSSIHNPDGTIDPYDGTVHPDEWTGQGVPLHAVRSDQLGHAQPHALLAIVVSSLRDRQNGNAPPALPDDDDDSSDGGTEHGDGEGGHGANNGDAGGKPDSDDQPGENPAENLESGGERRSERLARQGRTRSHEALPFAGLTSQDEEIRPLEPNSAILATGNQALVSLRRSATLKGWHRFSNAMFDQPVLKVQNLQSVYPAAPIVPLQSPFRPPSPDQITLQRFISNGTLGDVFAGSLILPLLQRTVTAAFKVMSTSTFAAKNWRTPRDRPFTRKEALGAFDTEASLLIRINSQSLGLVPLFYGMWKGQDRHGYQHRLMGMELLGEEAHQNMSLHDKDLVVACLSKLHSLGLTHGDITLRHFKRRQTGSSSSWAMIDLERSKERAATDVEFKAARREMAELKRLLGL